MTVESLGKLFKMCGPNAALKIRRDNDTDIVNFQGELTGEQIVDFDFKLMQIECVHIEILDQQYKVVVRLRYAEVQKMCRELKEFEETTQVQAGKEGIRFSVQGDFGADNVMLEPREACKPEDKVPLTMHEPVSEKNIHAQSMGRSSAAWVSWWWRESAVADS